MKKEDLEKEIFSLKRDLKGKVSSEKLQELLKTRNAKQDEINKAKITYKTARGKRGKAITVRNLLISTEIFLFLLPVVGCGVGGYALVNSVDKQEQAVCVYEDNKGNYFEYEDNSKKDLVHVETPWVLVKEDIYQKEIYEFDKSFKTEEQRQEILNSNYLEVLSDTNSNPVTTIYKNKEEIDDVAAMEESMIYVIHKDIERTDYTHLNEDIRDKIYNSVIVFACSLLGSVVSLFIGTEAGVHDGFKEAIEKKNINIGTYKKEEIKSLRKKYKEKKRKYNK